MCIMRSNFKLICFSWILNYACTAADNLTLQSKEQCPTNLFSITNLGHSSLLITWDGKLRYVYKLPVVMSWFSENSEHRANCYSPYGQCKLSSLKENKNYQIEITVSPIIDCWILGKTLLKKNYSRPIKPDFEFITESFAEISSNSPLPNQPIARIEWLPCGKKRFCKGREADASHFFVKFKMLYSRQEWRIYEYISSNTFIHGLLPGNPYEVVVTSISVGDEDLETDSDPQEVFITPKCASVRFAKILTFTNSSVIISWKPPQHCLWEADYLIFYSVSDSSPIVFMNYSSTEGPYKEKLILRQWFDYPNEPFLHSIIPKLTPGLSYIFFIIPLGGHEKKSYGFEYRIDHTMPQTNEVDLPLAKPEFYCKLDTDVCDLKVLWYPCGQTFDCKNTRPGSHFSIIYRNIDNGYFWREEQKDSLQKTLILCSKEIYEVSVESWDEYNNSESTKNQIIDTSNCVKQKIYCQ